MPEPAAPTSPPPAPSPPRILCVDDESSILAYYRKILEKRGYAVTTCNDGDRLLAVLVTHPADLVILDVKMPGISGIELLTRLRQSAQWCLLPVLLASGDGSEETVERGLALGADDYLVKPIQPGEMLAKVSTVLRRRRPGSLVAGDLPYGTTLSGRYRLTGQLGQGGFSTVYLGHDLASRQGGRVAIKVFSGEPHGDASFLSLFLREAYAHSRLDHPNIVALRDFGQSDNLYYLVMQYLEGHSLQEIVAAEGPLAERRAATIALAMSEALLELQANSLVHRDIKPRNIMISGGIPKLLDFGLVRLADDDPATRGEFRCGTPAFISPEYIRNDVPLDSRADVYSLGMTLYYLLTLKTPFPPCPEMDLIQHHLETLPMPIGMRRPELDPAFAALIDSMLFKDRELRPWPADVGQTLRLLLENALVE